MLDPNQLRTRLSETAAALRARGFELATEEYLRLETERKSLQIVTQQLQQERNSKSKAIGVAMARGKDAQGLLNEVADLGDRLKQAEIKLADVQSQIEAFSLLIPIAPMPVSPSGRVSTTIRRYAAGVIRPNATSIPKTMLT